MKSEHFTTPNNYPDDQAAMIARNTRAKELRKEGYSVKSTRVSFAGFGYGTDYLVEYKTKEEMGIAA